MDQLSALRAFITVMETKTFTEAAKRLGLSTSAVSKHVMLLEEHLGARLLHRTTRKLAPTEIGLMYAERVQAVLDGLAAADRLAQQHTIEPRGRLRVNAPMSFGQRCLAPAVTAFMRAHPKIEVELMLNDRMVDLVEEGFDLAVRIASLRDSSLIARRLAPVAMLLIAAPGYLARSGALNTPEDLTGHRMLSYGHERVAQEIVFADATPSFRPSALGVMHSNNGDLLLHAAVEGMGVAMLPSFIAGDALRAGQVVRVLPDRPLRELSVHAVYPATRQLSAKVRRFVDHLAARFGGTPYWDTGLFAGTPETAVTQASVSD